MQKTKEQSDKDLLILRLADFEKTILDAYLYNPSNKVNCYKIIKGISEGSHVDNDIISKRANQYFNNEAVKAYVERNRQESSYTGGEDLLNAGELDKDQIVLQLTALYQKATDFKLKSEILMKLSDLQGFKKETNLSSNDQIRYYLPENCSNCRLKYVSFKS